MTRFTSLLVSSLVISVAAAGCIISSSSGTASSLTVTNNSSFDLRELHLTFSTSSGWGPNLLGGSPLLPGERVTLDNISCDTYDVLMVDETGAMCEHDNLSLCLDAADFVITNNTCSVFKRIETKELPDNRTHTPHASQQ